jgi:hypothetical protein
MNYLHSRRNAVFAYNSVQVYLFIKIFNSISPQQVDDSRLTLRRMACVQYIREVQGEIPAFPIAVWSFGTAPFRNQEIENIRNWGHEGVINGNLAGGVGAPIMKNQAEFIVDIPANRLWIIPPEIPAGLSNLQIDLFEVLMQLRDLQ